MLINHRTKTIGFLGIDKYDIILYVAVILIKQEKKVLLIDHSASMALGHCIPIPCSLNPKLEKVSYHGIEYLQEKSFKDYLGDYHYIFIDYGFNADDIEQCDHMVLVSDKQLHNINRLKLVNKTQKKYSLILRDIEKDNNTSEIKNMFKDCGFNIVESYLLNSDEVDKKIKLRLQYENKISMKRLSYESKYFLEQFITKTLNIDKKEYIKAYKRVRRGA